MSYLRSRRREKLLLSVFHLSSSSTKWIGSEAHKKSVLRFHQWNCGHILCVRRLADAFAMNVMCSCGCCGSCGQIQIFYVRGFLVPCFLCRSCMPQHTRHIIPISSLSKLYSHCGYVCMWMNCHILYESVSHIDRKTQRILISAGLLVFYARSHLNLNKPRNNELLFVGDGDGNATNA